MNQRGWSVSEVLVVVWILGVVVAVVAGGADHAWRQAGTEAAARKVLGLLWKARSEAMVLGTASGLVFDDLGGERWRCRAVIDGDGDGILRSDIAAGTDRVFAEIQPLRFGSGRLGILQNVRVPDPSGSGTLGGNLSDPVRAGRGNIITFTGDGTATPSTLYFCDGAEHMRAVRVYGATGRIRTMAWRVGWPGWRHQRL